MKTIWKYPIAMTDVQNVTMPVGAEILSVQPQGGELQLWAIVDPEAAPEFRVIECVGTGHWMHDVGGDGNIRKHIDTVQLCGGSLVLHIFEVTPIKASGIRYGTPSPMAVRVIDGGAE